MLNNWYEVKLSEGFYYCRNQNQLDSLLKSRGISKEKYKIIVDIKHYPCIVTLDDRTLEIGKVFVYSMSKTDIEKVFNLLQDETKGT